MPTVRLAADDRPMTPRLASLALAIAVVCCGQAHAQAPVAMGDAPGTLRLPEAVAVTSTGELLVGDHFGGRIQRFRDGVPTGSVGFGGEACGQLGAVGGVAAGPNGTTFVLDTDRQRVQVFAADGTVVRCFGGRGSGRGQLLTTSGGYAASTASGGIAVAGGRVYVADTGNNRVQRFTLTGGEPKVIGRGVLAAPQGLAVRGHRLLVADDAHHRVVELTTSGRFVRATSREKGVRLRFPYDVAIAPSGDAYVADNNLHRIVQLDRRLRRVRTWGGEGSGPGKLRFPRSVAVAADGHVYVADAANDRVQEFTATGRRVRSIGSDGRAAGKLTAPTDVAANALGEIAVADGNGRIAWLDLRGTWEGAWAQSRSFQQSTAVVTVPASVDFAGDRTVRVTDSGSVRDFSAGLVRLVAGASPTDPAQRATFVGHASVGASATTWLLDGHGRFAAVPPGATAGPWIGEQLPTGRSATAIAELADGSVAVAEGTSPHQRNPADGSVRRYSADGRLLSTWTIARPAGGLPSIPAGLAADPAGGVWVSDAANDRVLALSPGGAVVASVGSAGPEGLSEPHGLALDCAGGLLVADTGANRVLRFPGVAAASGCLPAGTPTPATGHPPAPLALRLRATSRAKRAARKLAVVHATCRRTCGLRALAGGSTLRQGRPRSVTLRARVDGHTITISAGADARRALRGGDARVALTVTAIGAASVVDTAALSWSLDG
jgi:sugar lactone lactonase YvrE